MKKGLLLLGAATLLFSIGIIGFSSCDEETKDALSCAKLAAEVSSTQSDYTNSPTKATCNDYKKALQDYIDDCDELAQTEIAAYQATIDALDCDALD